MTFKPLSDRVQFERVENPAPKPGEIIVERRPNLHCRVIAVGPKCRHVAPGMTVLINYNVGMPVQGIAGRVCREGDIMAVVDSAGKAAGS